MAAEAEKKKKGARKKVKACKDSTTGTYEGHYGRILNVELKDTREIG